MHAAVSDSSVFVPDTIGNTGFKIDFDIDWSFDFDNETSGFVVDPESGYIESI